MPYSLLPHVSSSLSIATSSVCLGLSFSRAIGHALSDMCLGGMSSRWPQAPQPSVAHAPTNHVPLSLRRHELMCPDGCLLGFSTTAPQLPQRPRPQFSYAPSGTSSSGSVPHYVVMPELQRPCLNLVAPHFHVPKIWCSSSNNQRLYPSLRLHLRITNLESQPCLTKVRVSSSPQPLRAHFGGLHL